MAYSILIKNGTVFDGTGKEPYAADIGISGNSITRIGNLVGETADRIIDASDLYVTPGFIDLTNHSDVYGSIFLIPSQESLLRQGITTILLGNCGESLAPIAKKESLAELERWTTGFSVPINWNSVAEYYRNIETINVGLNTATLVGESTLGRNAADLPGKIFLLEKALGEGAWGLSSNFSFVGRNNEAELLSLLKIIKKNNALYKIHLRDEGKNFLPAVASAISLARSSGVRTSISHLKAVGRGAWSDFGSALRMLREAKKSGADISYDFFPYLRTGSMLVSLLPAWAREGGSENVLARISDKNTSRRIVADLQAATLHPEKIFIASALNDKAIVGKTLDILSSHMGISAEELILEILKVNKLNVSIFGKTISGKNLILAAQDLESAVSSDGAGYDTAFKRFGDLVHPRSFGAFPRFFNFISKKAGISPAKAVAKMTSLPAAILGLSARGVLRNGFMADIAIFHPEEFKSKSTYKNPYNYAGGVRFLILGGQIAIENGSLNPKRVGAVLRKKG